MPNPDTAAQVARLRSMAEEPRRKAEAARRDQKENHDEGYLSLAVMSSLAADSYEIDADLFSAAADALEREEGLVAAIEYLSSLGQPITLRHPMNGHGYRVSVGGRLQAEGITPVSAINAAACHMKGNTPESISRFRAEYERNKVVNNV